jgi:DNA-directed RNA polymerase specialized sigma24 family protein
VAVLPAWLDAGTSDEASEVAESVLEVVADGELVEDELDEELEESLAAPPPRAIEVVPLAELRAKSAETVCEIVPLVAFVVR